jgi:quaternary ammonium compound-resistance protein SugE
MDIIFLAIAAAAFSIGGLLMKLSAGLTRPLPSAGFLILFVAGASVQAIGMRRTDLGVAYIFVLGLEAVLTVLLKHLVSEGKLSTSAHRRDRADHRRHCLVTFNLAGRRL